MINEEAQLGEDAVIVHGDSVSGQLQERERTSDSNRIG